MRTLFLAVAAATLAMTGSFFLLQPNSGESEARALPIPPEMQFIGVAQDAMRGRLRQAKDLGFGHLQVFRFGPPDERAVCGTVRPANGPESSFILRILLPRDHAIRPDMGGLRPVTVMEQGPGLVHADANAATRYCRDVGAMVALTAAVSVSADTVPSDPAPAPPAAALQETVLVRSPARVRAAPGGEVLRIAARGETLGVFGRAPGGWLQVGDAAPQGWVHASLLSAQR
jgi:hypothetical protein